MTAFNKVNDIFIFTSKYFTYSFSYFQASHYIGLGCNVVLCIQMLTADATICGEQVSDIISLLSKK